MSRVFVIRRRHFGLFAVMAAAVLMTVVFLRYERMDEAVSGTAVNPRVIQLVTGEFESRAEDGRKIEAYIWHPGTVYVRKGETVELQIKGISGGNHPFVIEGLGVKGEVRTGETTKVVVTPAAAGTYPILCLTHLDQEQGGPMVGYIVVQ